LLRGRGLSNVNRRESVVLDRLCALEVLIDGLRVRVVDVMTLFRKRFQEILPDLKLRSRSIPQLSDIGNELRISADRRVGDLELAVARSKRDGDQAFRPVAVFDLFTPHDRVK